MVRDRDDIVGIDAAILMHPKVWETSGHVQNFKDPKVDCKSCKARWRPDDLNDGKCPKCGNRELTEPRMFNLMFKTHMDARVRANGDGVFCQAGHRRGDSSTVDR